MGIFGGPSKDTLHTVTHGIAVVAMQIHRVQQEDDDQREILLNNMRNEGAPTNMNELIHEAAAVIRELNMGWYKKSQFLGMVFSSLVSVGFSMADAKYIQRQIELLSSISG